MAQDPYKYFRVEARELLDAFGKAVLDLEKSPSSADLVSRLLRLAHALEDVLAPYRETPGPVPRDQIDFVLKLLDSIGKCVAALAAAPAQEADLLASQPQPDAPLRTVRADIAEV